MSKIKARITGTFSKSGFSDYQKKLLIEKRRALEAAQPEAVKRTKQVLGNVGLSTFKVKSKSFRNIFASRSFNQKPDKLPSVLFYTRSHYFGIFETGGKITPAGKKGLLIPLVNLTNRKSNKAVPGALGGKDKFFQQVEELRKKKLTFWKRSNGKLLLFVKTGADTKTGFSKFKKQYRENNNIKRLKTGTAIPIAYLAQSVTIKKMFAFKEITKNEYLPNLSKAFEKKLKL